MDDRELLEKAARAAKIRGADGIDKDGTHWWYNSSMDGTGRTWNPLENDGDAFRLMVRLNLNIEFDAVDGGVGVYCHADYDGGPDTQLEVFERSQDSQSATRRAIVRAASAMGDES